MNRQHLSSPVKWQHLPDGIYYCSRIFGNFCRQSPVSGKIAFTDFASERKVSVWLKIYGLKTCPYCDFVKQQLKGREDEFQYIDIGTNVKYMHEFIDLRDHRPEFDHSKKIGDIGIPAFVLEDGSITLDPAKVGLIEYDPSIPACSLEDHKNGKKGC